MLRYKIGLAMERESGFARSVLKGISDALQSPDVDGVELDVRFMFVNPKDRDVPNIADYDGYLCQVFDDGFARRLLRTGKPVVDVYVAKRRKGISAVECDHYAIAELAVEHFIDRGFSKFAFCGFCGSSFSDERERHFSELLAQRGYHCQCYRVGKRIMSAPSGRFDPRDEYIERPSDYREIEKWAKSLEKGTAVFCCNDQRACQFIRRCEECNLRIPEDLAVLGVDDEVLLCNFFSPRLSSIGNNPEICGREAVKLLRKLLVTPAAHRTDLMRKVLPSTLVERESTDLYRYEPKWLSEAVRFIRTGFGGNLTASEVIARTGMSHTTVELAFRKTLGHSVQTEIVNTRYREAIRMLLSSALDIGEIAKRTGFGSLNYFSASFSRRYHCSPGQYRAGQIPA